MIELTERERQLINARLDIEAIKHVRQRTGCGLIEAKQARDSFFYSKPKIAEKIRERFTQVLEGLALIVASDDLGAMRRVNRKFDGFFVEKV